MQLGSVVERHGGRLRRLLRFSISRSPMAAPWRECCACRTSRPPAQLRSPVDSAAGSLGLNWTADHSLVTPRPQTRTHLALWHDSSSMQAATLSLQQRPAALRTRARRTAVRCAAVPPAIEKVAGDQVRRLRAGRRQGRDCRHGQLPVGALAAAAASLAWRAAKQLMRLPFPIPPGCRWSRSA